jgi:hypothetical protein
MKKFLAIAALTVILPALASAGAKILVPETSWDFGHSHNDGQLSHPYWIKNIGDDTLRISVKPG